jgi:hypothetical protein
MCSSGIAAPVLVLPPSVPVLVLVVAVAVVLVEGSTAVVLVSGSSPVVGDAVVPVLVARSSVGFTGAVVEVVAAVVEVVAAVVEVVVSGCRSGAGVQAASHEAPYAAHSAPRDPGRGNAMGHGYHAARGSSRTRGRGAHS